MKSQIISIVALSMSLLACAPALAQGTLQGGVQVNNQGLRLSRPASVQSGATTTDAIPVAPSRFAARAQASGGGLVDTRLFAGTPGKDALPATLAGQAANNKFDIGAERGSKVLTLAWEAWHKQLCAEIYARWQDVAMVRGRATMKVTVTRDHHVTAQITDPSGKPAFDSILLRVIASMDGNPGLTFPSGSQRKEVSFEADYVADSNVRGGYSWTKNDYETVRENY